MLSSRPPCERTNLSRPHGRASDMVKMSGLDDLERRVRACTACSLAEKRTNAVPGEGSPTADLVFIGEGPGFYEDRDGRPFVGPAGKFLEELLASIGLTRADVYITNMVKCRPPNNRDPLPGEIQACKPFLDEQLETIAPRVIVTLGRYSFAKFFPGESIGRARGKPRPWMKHDALPHLPPGSRPPQSQSQADDHGRLQPPAFPGRERRQSEGSAGGEARRYQAAKPLRVNSDRNEP